MMKFSDGYWRADPGLQSLFALQAREVAEHDDGFTVFAPVRPVAHLRNTLNNPVIWVTLWSPFPDAIGVRIVHHGGGVPHSPSFDLASDPEWKPAIDRSDDEIVLRAGSLSAHVSLAGPWQLEFRRDGEVLTASGHRSIATATNQSGDAYTYQRLMLPEGDLVYGLGERSTPLVRNGQSIDTWNDDGGPSSWHSYKAIPFFLTDRGWGVFVDSPGKVSYEICSEFTSQVQFAVPGQRLEYVLFARDTPKQVLSLYTRLTGRPSMPPPWSFGLWLSTSFVTDYDHTTMAEMVDAMAAREMPVGVAHFDSFWMREFRWCDFEWDPRRFPDPQRMLADLHAKGTKVCVWINPYVAERSSLFAEAAAAGFLLRRPNGDVWQTDTWQAGMGIVDFTNPDARTWYAGKLKDLCAMGVDCFKTDFGERIPLDVVFHDGSDPALAHNYYSYLYNRTVTEAIEAVHGAGEAVVFARSATVGGQCFPVHWGGDPEPTFQGMAETLRQGLSLGLSGFGFWSHDIGGFEGSPSPTVFTRWAAFGLLSSHSRLHGSTTYRVPWEFGEDAARAFKRFYDLRQRLLPYLQATAREAVQHGWPVLRAMVLEFPDDPTCRSLDRQYMLGPDLLVAPVMREDGAVTFYLPDGDWTDLLSGRTVHGGRWHTQCHELDSIPVLLRPGAVLPMASAPGHGSRANQRG